MHTLLGLFQEHGVAAMLGAIPSWHTAQHPPHSASCQGPSESQKKKVSSHQTLLSLPVLALPLLSKLQCCSQGCPELLGIHSIPPLILKKH